MTVEEAVQKFLDNNIKDIIEAQKAQRFYASGKTAKSLKAKVKKTKTKVSGSLTGDEAFYYQINGRKPGKMPPIKSIQAWIKAKRIDVNPWAVAKSIAKNGTAVWQGKRRGLDISLRLNLRQEQLAEDLGEAYRLKIDSLFKQIEK